MIVGPYSSSNQQKPRRPFINTKELLHFRENMKFLIQSATMAHMGHNSTWLPSNVATPLSLLPEISLLFFMQSLIQISDKKLPHKKWTRNWREWRKVIAWRKITGKNNGETISKVVNSWWSSAGCRWLFWEWGARCVAPFWFWHGCYTRPASWFWCLSLLNLI